jgi:hypothetical protein
LGKEKIYVREDVLAFCHPGRGRIKPALDAGQSEVCVLANFIEIVEGWATVPEVVGFIHPIQDNGSSVYEYLEGGEVAPVKMGFVHL